MHDANVAYSTICDNNDLQGVSGPTPRSKLLADDWAVAIPRADILSSRLGPLLVLLAATAWRDRGPQWAVGEEGAASTPPRGWAALVGCSRASWWRWQKVAVKSDLVHEVIGTDSKGCEHNLLKPNVWLEPGEQFARLPISVMFDGTISATARRVFAALACFRQPSGEVSAATSTIAKMTGIHRRHIQRSFRELEEHFALVRMPRNPRASGRWMMISTNAPAQDVPNPPRPCSKSAAPMFKIVRRPVSNPPPSQELSQESVQESLSSAREGAREADDDDGLHNDPVRNMRQFGMEDLSGLTPDWWDKCLQWVSRWPPSEDQYYVIRSARRERERLAARVSA